MICRRCGNRIPEYLVGRESFRCPECGRQFGTPTEDRGQTYAQYEPRRSRYEDDYDRRPLSRFEDPDDRYYDDRAADGYYDDGQSYADSQPYDDGYYDDGQYYDDSQPYDDGYYDNSQEYYDDSQGYYEDGQGYYDDSQDYYADSQPYYDDQPVYDDDDLSDLMNGGEPRPAGMKLTTVLYVLVAAIVVLIVVFCVDAGLNGGKEAAAEPTAQPAIEATADPALEATESPYPAV